MGLANVCLIVFPFSEETFIHLPWGLLMEHAEVELAVSTKDSDFTLSIHCPWGSGVLSSISLGVAPDSSVSAERGLDCKLLP